MSLFRTIAALGSAVAAVMAAYFFGHGISNGHATPFVVAGAAAVLAVILVLAQVRIGRGGESVH